MSSSTTSVDRCGVREREGGGTGIEEGQKAIIRVW